MSSVYSDRDFEEVLRDVANGASLASACKVKGRPSRHMVLKRIKADEKFSRAWGEALHFRAEACMDKLIEVNERLEEMRLDPHSARQLSQNLMWMASKWNPARYGDKIKTELSGPNNTPLIPERPAVDDLELARLVAHLAHQAGMRSALDFGELRTEPPLLGRSS